MKRNLYYSLETHLAKKEFTLLIGGRQTGKSTLLKDLQLYCKKNSIPQLFMNLENRGLLAELNANPVNLLRYLSTSDKKTIVFLDEIQYLEDPSNFLKLLYDEYNERVKIVASGSSAFYIDQKFKDSLAGRKRIFQLLTCDFQDYLGLQGKEELWDEVKKLIAQPNLKSLKRDLLWVEWEKFILFGGYPAVVTEPDENYKKEILKEIRDSFIKRDIMESGVRNEILFHKLLQILAEQSGQLLNINELSNTLRARNETIQHYLFVMQKCFHLVLIKPFFANIRKELIKMPKGYLLDTGLRNSLLNNYQPLKSRMDRGLIWEQQLFRVLLDQFGQDELRFWRTAEGKEIDFIIPNHNPPLALEAKFDERSAKIKKYQLFLDTYPQFNFQFAFLEPWNEDVFRKIYPLR